MRDAEIFASADGPTVRSPRPPRARRRRIFGFARDQLAVETNRNGKARTR
jgi:hypothetical protein